MKFTTTLPDGRHQVNKSDIIQYLIKLKKYKQEAIALGTIPVSNREIEQETKQLVQYTADKFINQSDD